MRNLKTLFLGVLLCLPLQAFAQNPAPQDALRVDVSRDMIEVTTGFNGASLTVFGMQETEGDVVLVVEGPLKSFTVREKGRRLGLWTNVEARVFPNVPTYYEIASNVPLADIALPDVLKEHQIGIENLSLPERRGSDSGRVQRYRRALIKSQQDKKLYVTGRRDITHINAKLFKAEFILPAVVTPGRYGIYAYLFLDGKIVGHDQVRFEVRPEGMSADITWMAQHMRLLYGLLSVMIAVFSGWLATVLLKRD